MASRCFAGRTELDWPSRSRNAHGSRPKGRRTSRRPMLGSMDSGRLVADEASHVRDLRAEVAELFDEAQYLGDQRFFNESGLHIRVRPEHARRASGLCPRCGGERDGPIQCAPCLIDSQRRYQRRKVRLGIGGKEQGGFARARSLSPERRAEIGRRAAKGRWGYSGSSLAAVSVEDIYARYDIRSTHSGYVVFDRMDGAERPGRISNRKQAERWCARSIVASMKMNK